MKTRKVISIFTLLTLLLFVFATPVFAFEGREGDSVVISADEVIDDDLYVTATEFVLDGTVNGDLVVFAQTVIINGDVEGDLIAGAQAIQINGSIGDDVRVGGMALQIGSDAMINDDVLFGGFSMEAQAGSTVNGDVVTGAGQALLAGDIGENLWAGVGGLELQGTINGDVKAYVDQTEESQDGPPPSMFMNFGPPLPFAIPSMTYGLAVADSAEIGGDLEYSSTYEMDFPSGVVSGEVSRVEPEITESETYVPPTALQRTGKWALGSLRTVLTLVLFGLLIGWLAPAFLNLTAEKIRTQIWPSLGWGAVSWAAFFFALLLIVIVMMAGGIIFGFLTLGDISGTIIWLGILSMFALIVTFVLATAYVSKIVVGAAVGRWIFSKINPSLAEHRFWPMILGVVVIAVVIALFRFPLLPLGFFGWLLNFAVVLLGLGALWLWGRERFAKQPAG